MGCEAETRMSGIELHQETCKAIIERETGAALIIEKYTH